MRVLVTGANGQLGSELRDVFNEQGVHEVFFLDRKQLPLEQTSIIQDIVGMYQPEIIIHTAAYTAVDRAESEQEQANKVNHLASEEIAQYCHVHDCKLIAISTDYVFDGLSSEPLSEDAEVDPINVYGKTKLLGEQAVQKWVPDSIVIRTSWVYSVYGTNFVKTMLRLMHERSEISVVADQIGSPTYARDLATAIVAIVSGSKWEAGIYNYSNEGTVSWYEFALAIQDVAGLDCSVNPVDTSAYPTAARRPRYSLLDKRKVKEVYDLQIPNWKDSLHKMIALVS